MARRRRIGNALESVGGGLLDFAMRQMQTQQQHKLASERQQELARLNDQLRREAANDQRTFQEEQAVLGDPTGGKAEMLVRGGKAQYAGMVPTTDVATDRFGAGLNKINDRKDLIGDLGLETGLAATPGGSTAAKDPRAIEKLIGLRNERRSVLGASEDAAVTQAGKTSFTQAENQGLGKESADAANFPAQLGRKTTEFNTMTPLEVGRAGKVTAAQEGARNAAELAQLSDPRYLNAKLNIIKQEGIAKALAERNKDHASMVNDAATSIASITPDWERMKILSSTVNAGDMAQPGTYYVGSKLQVNKDASELDSIGQNMAKRLANNALFGGNKGAQSEKDSEAISNRLPNSYDSKESARRKIIAFENNMLKGLKAMSELPPNAAPQDKINIMRQSIGLPPVDLASPPGAIDPMVDANRRFDLLVGAPPMAPVPTHRR
jgi:hypothetical protein